MNLRLLTQCETLPKIFKIQLQHHSSFDVISVICMLKKSCWKVVTKPWIDGFMDWIEWPAQQMTEEAKVWIDHHRRSIIEHWLTLFLHEFLISSLDTINYSTWWSTGPDDKSYSELDCYLHLFYDTHLSSASLDSIVMKKKTTKQILRQSSPIKNTSLPRNLHYWKLRTVQSRI